jgi:hypothetical protein
MNMQMCKIELEIPILGRDSGAVIRAVIGRERWREKLTTYIVDKLERQAFWTVLMLWAHLCKRYRFRNLEMRIQEGWLETQLLRDLLQLRFATIVINPITTLGILQGPKEENNSIKIFLITCYSCNQHGHYSRDWVSPRKWGECFKYGGVEHYAMIVHAACNERRAQMTPALAEQRSVRISSLLLYPMSFTLSFAMELILYAFPSATVSVAISSGVCGPVFYSISPNRSQSPPKHTSWPTRRTWRTASRSEMANSREPMCPWHAFVDLEGHEINSLSPLIKSAITPALPPARHSPWCQTLLHALGLTCNILRDW